MTKKRLVVILKYNPYKRMWDMLDYRTRRFLNDFNDCMNARRFMKLADEEEEYVRTIFIYEGVTEETDDSQTP